MPETNKGFSEDFASKLSQLGKNEKTEEENILELSETSFAPQERGGLASLGDLLDDQENVLSPKDNQPGFSIILDDFTEGIDQFSPRTFTKNFFPSNPNRAQDQALFKVAKEAAARFTSGSALESGEKVVPPQQAKETPEPGTESFALEVEKVKAERLRNSPYFQILFAIIRRDPSLFRELSLITARRTEFKKHHEGKAHHRNFTALFSALVGTERTKRLLDLAIDRTVKDESDELKREIREQGKDFSHELRVGTGVHSAIYSLVRQTEFPKERVISMDKNSIIGGQFALYGKPIFRLNSRNRQDRPNEKHLPGTRNSLNTLRRYATLQPADTSAETYQPQTAVADSARVDGFLAGSFLVDVELTRVTLSLNGEKSTLISTSRDTKNRSNRYVQEHDRIIITSGIGREADGFDPNDERSERIKRDEENEFNAGRDAKVMTFVQFLQRMADPAQAFPMRNMKRLVLCGAGDSGNVAAGIPLGYELKVGKEVTTLDSLEEIIWVGQEFPSKEKFIDAVRARYDQLGLEFPRDTKGLEDYYHRITPVRGKAVRRERAANGDIRYIVQLKDEKGEYIRDADGKIVEKAFEGDHGIEATGFVDETDKIMLSLYQDELDVSVYAKIIQNYRDIIQLIKRNFAPRTDQELLTDQGKQALEANRKSFKDYLDNQLGIGAKLIYKTNLNNRNAPVSLEIINLTPGSAERTLGYKLTYPNGKTTIRGINKSLESIVGPNSLFNPDNILEIVRGIPKMEMVYDKQGADPIAVKYPNTRDGRQVEVYKAGPAAGLRLTEDEKKQAPALELIKENTASIFRYAEYTERLAKLLAKQDRQAGYKPEIPEPKQPEYVDLPKFTPTASSGFQRGYDVIEADIEKRVPYDAHIEDYLKFAVASRLYNYNFPKNLSGLEFTIGRSKTFQELPDDGKTFYLQVDTKPPLPDRKQYNEMLNDLFTDPTLQRVLQTLFENQSVLNRTGPADAPFGRRVSETKVKPGPLEIAPIILKVPLANGLVDMENIGYTIPRTTPAVPKRRPARAASK